MIEVIFLLVLGIVWLVFASISDVKTTEIFNWLSFSLIIFALGFRLFYSLFSAQGFEFFYQGLIGFGIFFVVGNFLYYSRVFAGGDYRLMISLGAVLPFSTVFSTNMKIFVTFLFLFLLAGSVYGLFTSAYLAIKNPRRFRKEFKIQGKRFLKLGIPIAVIGIAIAVFGLFFNILVFYLGLVVLVMPLLFVFSKAVDESCMVKEIKTSELMEGDWLYKNVKVGSKTIKADWNGLTKKDIGVLKKKPTVVVRRGIAFAPVFLISFLALIYFYFLNSNLLNLLWNPFG